MLLCILKRFHTLSYAFIHLHMLSNAFICFHSLFIYFYMHLYAFRSNSVTTPRSLLVPALSALPAEAGKKRIRNCVFSWMKILFSFFLLRSFIKWSVISMPSAAKLIKGCIVYERSEKWLYTKMNRCSCDINVLHGRCWMSFVYWLSFPVSDRGVCFGLSRFNQNLWQFQFQSPCCFLSRRV